MKVLLVRPSPPPEVNNIHSFSLLEPLALEYLGAGIQQNHDVRVLDMLVEGRLSEVMMSYQPDIVACGACTAEVMVVKSLLAEAKRIRPDVLTVVGGHHATLIPADFFDENVDLVVMKEGVRPFKLICDAHERGSGFEGIGNIYYRKQDRPTFTFEEEHPPLDSLPFPARNLTSAYRATYGIFLPTGLAKVALLRTSTGCAFNCSFCAISKCLDRKVHSHAVERVIAELQSLSERFVFLVDDEFLLDPKRAMAIAQEIEKAGIKKNYWIFGRADSIVRNPESVEAWARIGLQYVMMGLESHRECDLKRMRKGTSISQNEQAVKICQSNGVRVKGNFLVQPDFDRNDFKALAAYAQGLGVDVPSFSIMTPFPGTDLFDELRSEITSFNYNLFDMGHVLMPTRLPLKEFYRETAGLFIKSVPMGRRLQVFRQLGWKQGIRLFRRGAKFLRQVKQSYVHHEERNPAESSNSSRCQSAF